MDAHLQILQVTFHLDAYYFYMEQSHWVARR